MEYASADLIGFGRNVPIPCTVTLVSEGIEKRLEILQVLRILPGKRLTAVARFDGRKIVAKLFFHPQAWRRKLTKDLQGIQAFTSNKLATPKILSQHHIKGIGGAILIEYLQTGVSLADYFLDSEKVSRRESDKVLSLIFSAICNCHNSRIWQGDMHLGNYMLSEDKLYLIDGGDVERLAKPLSKTKRLENIADFIAQFPVYFDDRIELMLKFYQGNYKLFSSADLATIEPLVLRLRMKRLSLFEKKVFRSTSANRNNHSISVRYAYDRVLKNDDVAQFLKNPDSYIKSEKMLKDGDSTTVVTTTIGGTPMVLKRYNIVSKTQRFKRLFDESRGYRCWRNASMLGLLGICTPRPYVFLEERLFWIFGRRAYFLAEQIPLDNLLIQLEGADEELNQDKLVAAFANLFEVMYRYQISHGDMKASNFIFKKGKLYVLDLDGMRRHRFKWWSKLRSINDMKRFERNWIGSRYEEVFAPMIKQYYENRQVLSRG